MVQEVQQQWNRYQTPEIIPWVWISERRIKEHTQVTPARTYSCLGYSNTVGGMVWGATPDINVQGTLTISTQKGGVRFAGINKAIRIPIGGIYQIQRTAQGGLTWIAAVHKLIVNGNTISTLTTNPGAASATIIVSLGKFDMVEYYLSAHYGWSDGNGVYGKINSITIQKL